MDKLGSKIADMRAELKEHRDLHNEQLDAIWGAMYPNEPGGWEYPGQIIRAAKEIREESDTFAQLAFEAQEWLEAIDQELVGVGREQLQALIRRIEDMQYKRQQRTD